MFIELTDHLRCPAEHAEQFLVLLPDAMKGRRVISGSLGCPVCGRVVMIESGQVDFGGAPPLLQPSRLTAPAVAALLGLEGPGGYLAILGGGGAIAGELCSLLPGIQLILVNPPTGAGDLADASGLRAGRMPIKARSMRGVVVSADHGADPAWAEAAVRAVLPGNRVVVEGPPVAAEGLEVLATADGLWVARTATERRS